MRAGRIIRVVGLAFAVVLVGLSAHLAALHLNGNFHPVVPGEVYRSAQVSPEDLKAYAARFGIKSVLNLRGAAAGSDWYDAEVRTSEGLGLVHADFAMSSSVVLEADEAARLIALMRDLPKPLLVHCRHGSDRTGLAMALYLAAIKGAGEDQAEGQLSLWFGHFAVPYLSDAWPMDESWERLEERLGFADS